MSWDIQLYTQVQGAKMAQAQTNLLYILENGERWGRIDGDTVTIRSFQNS